MASVVAPCCCCCFGCCSGGHLETLKWLRKSGCPWDEFTTRMAASSGNLEVRTLTLARAPFFEIVVFGRRFDWFWSHWLFISRTDLLGTECKEGSMNQSRTRPCEASVKAEKTKTRVRSKGIHTNMSSGHGWLGPPPPRSTYLQHVYR